MIDIPRYVSLATLGLGCCDILHAAGHTLFPDHIAPEVADLDMTEPTGLDQLTVMVTLCASNVSMRRRRSFGNR
ncbi:MAG: hypothetical protein KTR21_04760 [Rhodobacteraceae bacterium]|nr:hypothetical protein [Paracoccaceae bacterium]